MSGVDTVKELINDMLSPHRKIFSDSFDLYDDIFGRRSKIKTIGHSHLRRVNDGLNSTSSCFCVDKDTVVVIYNGKLGFWHKGYLLFVRLNSVGRDGWSVGLDNGKPVAYSGSRCIKTVVRVDRNELLPKYVEPVIDNYFVLPIVSEDKLRGIECGGKYCLSPLCDGELFHYGDFNNIVPNAMFNENVRLVLEGEHERLEVPFSDFLLSIKLGILPLGHIVNVFNTYKSLSFYIDSGIFTGEGFIYGKNYAWRDGILYRVKRSDYIVLSEDGSLVPFGGERLGKCSRNKVLRLLM